MSNEDTRHDYWRNIADVAQQVWDHAVAEDPNEPQWTDIGSSIHESVDGSRWVIYTHLAQKVMAFTDSDDALFDYAREPSGNSWSEVLRQFAYFAMSADVRDAMQGLVDDYEPPSNDDDDDDDDDE